ncbi:MAG: phosphoribosylformylglycinamidine synthase subunit PurL [Alphaproteobacteria bacterium]|nr:phosphoribosylformylglycinamidine synthase subunit PurL [Alphaproteobacteria bacterium]MCL2505056.1 phosphoribosylformylglycinamidine synthase subunit PurL [Alphaproteobacteria bacterium]
MTNIISEDETSLKDLLKDHGMTEDEYKVLKGIINRTPTLAEFGVFAAMWSEHCSYKSTRVWLKKLPTKAPWVICGPGENAGVIDIGDGQATVFKLESHNHPSFIEPYQGAATGVGGILRDVFTMGARPVANMNALKFGDINHPKTASLVEGVVAGISGYGNCVGVPNVGGETAFHSSYNGNILVNAMTVGIANKDKIFYSKAAGVGNPVVYVGSKTGRDGIKGATMASGEFSEDSESKRPTVQVGDPFTEKLLMEACFELMNTGAVVSIQDMGAAGLTSSSVEMASKGGLGIELDLDKVPCREEAMTAYEIMLSESQERMLIVLNPAMEKQAEAIFKKWELDFAVIGHLTNTKRIICTRNSAVEIDIPVDPLVEKAPVYERPWEPTPQQEPIDSIKYRLPAGKSILGVLKELLATSDLCSKRWIWEQYDNYVRGNTVQGSGGDAALVRLDNDKGEPTKRGIAISTDCTPRYCLADPVMGAKQAVAETYRNISAVGAKPLAITDNMNFGNPEKPRIMGQFVGAVEGIKEACLALDYPVISGNCSLYNETDGKAILPTPEIGAVGIIEDVNKAVNIAFKEEDESVFLIGSTKGHIGQSIYLREVFGLEKGTPPFVDLTLERKNSEFVRDIINEGIISACHDVSDGGLLVALAEMSLASEIGVKVTLDNTDEAFWFGEDQARFLISTKTPDAFLSKAKQASIETLLIGTTCKDKITIGNDSTDIQELKKVHDIWIP